MGSAYFKILNALKGTLLCGWLVGDTGWASMEGEQEKCYTPAPGPSTAASGSSAHSCVDTGAKAQPSTPARLPTSVPRVHPVPTRKATQSSTEHTPDNIPRGCAKNGGGVVFNTKRRPSRVNHYREKQRE